MTAKVIQGFFVGGRPRLPSPVVQPKAMPGPPAPAFAGRLPVAQPRLPGPPAPAFAGRPPGPPAPAFAGRPPVAQRHGPGAAFAVEAGQLGLASGSGRPLPEAVRGKMEAALGADFSGVRVHVGPQAERIGAIAFTLGSDIYFAPGRFQPETAHGQQLLGHELAHVVQQRAGRVRNPLGSGIAVVQDHALEAEADRLGHRAATHRVVAQPKMTAGAVQPSSPVRISPPINAGPGSYRMTAGAGGRQVGSVMVHARDKASVEVTDLGVEPTQRGHGVGQMLVVSAAKTGLQFGRSKVTLAAQDKGTGHLTQWYREMGFTQIGVNQRGYPQLEAPISRLLSVAQTHAAVNGAAERRSDRHRLPNHIQAAMLNPNAVVGGGIQVNQLDQDDQTYVGKDLMKARINSAYKGWSSRWKKRQCYDDEATGYRYGETHNPYFITAVEWKEIKEWWLAKKTLSGSGYHFVVVASASQGNDPGYVWDLIAAPLGQQPGGKQHFNFHVRVKN